MSYANPRALVVILTTACAILFSQADVSAQNNDPSVSQNLTSAPELPDIPPYTGKDFKFKSGTVQPNARGGPVYVVRLDVKEPKNQVIDWYDNVFRMYKWKHEKYDDYIKARHPQGHICIVSVSTALPDSNARTAVTIRYHLIQR